MEDFLNELLANPLRLGLAVVVIALAVVVFLKLSGIVIRFALEVALFAVLLTVLFGGFGWVEGLFDFFSSLINGTLFEGGVPQPPAPNLLDPLEGAHSGVDKLNEQTQDTLEQLQEQ